MTLQRLLKPSDRLHCGGGLLLTETTVDAQRLELWLFHSGSPRRDGFKTRTAVFLIE